MNNSNINTTKKLIVISIVSAMSCSVYSKNSEENIAVDDLLNSLENDHVFLKPTLKIIRQEDIVKSGMTILGEYLQRLPEFNGSPQNTKFNLDSNGEVNVDLRGINRTLVLINGRRSVSDGDFQSIPIAMIDRIEIVKEGGSATYGSGAIAGTINIVTRNDFSGLEVNAQTSNLTETGAGSNDYLSIISGTSTDKSQFIWGLEWNEQAAARQSDMPWSFMQHSFFYTDPVSLQMNGPLLQSQDPVNFNLVPFGSTRIPQGNFNLNGNTAFSNLFGCGSVTTPTGSDAGNVNNYRCYNGNFTDPNNDSYNYAPVRYLQTPYERLNLFSEGEYALNENTSIFGEIRISHRESSQQQSGLPYDSRFQSGYQVNVLDLGGNFIRTANGISGQNVYNPFGEDIIRARRRMLESSRVNSQLVDQFEYTVGIEGQINQSWSYESSFNYGYRHRTDQQFGHYSNERLRNALGPSFYWIGSQPVCGTTSTPIVDCVPLNLFGGEGSVTQEMLDYIQVTLVDTYKTKQEIFNLSFFGELWEFDGRTAHIATGVEHRNFSHEFQPDSAKEFDLTTAGEAEGINGKYSNTAYFLETFIPVNSSLEVTAAYRKDDYSNEADFESSKFGLAYHPSNELSLFYSFDNSFSEPDIHSLFSSEYIQYNFLSLPCDSQNWPGLTVEQQRNCSLMGVPDGGWSSIDLAVSVVGGNSSLESESSSSQSIGLVWQPDYFEGFKLSAVYWETDVDNVISTVNIRNLLNTCVTYYIGCDLIDRYPGGAIELVDLRNQNIAAKQTKGYDWHLSYHTGSSFGIWNFDLSFSELSKRREYEFQGAEFTDHIGVFDSDILSAAFPKDKLNLNIQWKKDRYTVNYSMYHLSSIYQSLGLFGDDELCQEQPGENINCIQIDSQTYHDLSMSINFDHWDSELFFGITNLTNESPPFIDSGIHASTDPSTYRLLGRGWFLRLSQEF